MITRSFVTVGRVGSGQVVEYLTNGNLLQKREKEILQIVTQKVE